MCYLPTRVLLSLISPALSVIISYFDFSYVFDKESHPKLLTKLTANGISDRLLSWPHSFLTKRIQRTSEVKLINSVIVQGSLLSPHLFTRCLNDLCGRVGHDKAFIFANDTKVAFSFKSSPLSDIKDEINGDISSISNVAN